MRNQKTEDHSIISQEDISLIKLFINDKDKKNLNNIITRLDPIVIGNNSNVFSDEEIIKLKKLIDKELFTIIFAYLENDQIEFVLSNMKKQEITSLFDYLYKDDIIDILESIDDKLEDEVFRCLSPKTRKIIKELQSYGEGTVGYEMNPEFIKFYENDTVKTAINKIKNKESIIENSSIIFVVSKKGILAGYLQIKDLLFAKSTSKLSEFVRKNIIFAKTHQSIEEAAILIRKFNLSRLPIISKDYELMGTISSDDVISILVEEATDDIHKLYAIGEIEESYMKSSVITILKSRVFWLIFLLFVATSTESIINSYDDDITGVLSVIIPLVMATAGNSGGQASATVIRSMATGEVSTREYYKVLWKELKVSTVIGIILFGFNYGRMWLISSDNFTEQEMLVISMGLGIIVIASKLIGGLLPLIAKKIKLDPATMAGPIVTTVVDIMSVALIFWLYTTMV